MLLDLRIRVSRRRCMDGIIGISGFRRIVETQILGRAVRAVGSERHHLPWASARAL